MYKASYKEYTLKFKISAGTSRGVMIEKKTWFLTLEKDRIKGIGECSVITGLSIDNINAIPRKITELCSFINKGNDPLSFDLSGFPSIIFGLEIALKDIEAGGKAKLFPSVFTEGKEGIPINGLIWMGDEEFMKKQIQDKLGEGYKCIKIKIGNLDFETELNIIKDLRKNHPEIEIRLDANGAFEHSEALEKLKQLSEYNIHSIEQPIKVGQIQAMAEICEKSPVPVALDEELISVSTISEKAKLLSKIKPKYIILKPGLLGGYEKTAEWIEIANETETGWWITSALESNVGLNAIAQWTYLLNTQMVQGLGTGQLYENNIPSPLFIKDTMLYFNPENKWDYSSII